MRGQAAPLWHPPIARGENDWKFGWVERRARSWPAPGTVSEYHVPTGRCLAYPNIPALRSYEVVAEDGKVKVRL